MDAEYWIKLDVDSEKLSMYASKSPKKVLRKLMLSNFWPAPTQKLMQEITGTTLTNIELVEQLQKTHKTVLEDLLCVTYFGKTKGNDILLKVINEKSLLTSEEIEKCKIEKNDDRVALLYQVFCKSPSSLTDLYWYYVLERRDFSPYALHNQEGKLFYKSLSTDSVSFQNQFGKNLNKKCYCWHVFNLKDKKIYCMRAFSTDKILHQLKNNMKASLAKTAILIVFNDGHIGVPSAAKIQTLKIANSLATTLYKTKCKFERAIQSFDKSNLTNVGKNLLNPKKDLNLKVLGLEIKQAPIDGNPNINFWNMDGLEETIKNLKKIGIDLNKHSEKISKITFSVDDIFRTVKFSPISNGKLVAVCTDRRMSDNHKALLTKYFDACNVKINFGSGKFD